MSQTNLIPNTKNQNRDETQAAPVSAEKVRAMLRELAYAMHATKVVGWKGGIAPKKG